LAQTLPAWELIVIDDASPDGTWQEILRFDDARIVSLRHETNYGAHATLNDGLALADGKYIAILNSDDVFHPERLERTVAFLEADQADLVGTDINLIGADGNVVTQDHPWLDWYENRRRSLRGHQDIVDALLAGNFFVTTSNFVFRREVFAQVGGFSSLRYAHDYEFLFRAALGSRVRLAFLEGEKLLSYRMHGANTVLENFLEVHRETISLLCKWAPRAVPEQYWLRARIVIKHLEKIESFIEYELTCQVDAADARSRTLVADVAEREAHIQSLSGDVAEREAQIQSLSYELAERDARIREISADLFGRDHQIQSLLAGVANCESALDEIKRSNSWRITGPLRTLSRWLSNNH
jgi:glycosyltransferase involved in cell wall biosynthesis